MRMSTPEPDFDAIWERVKREIEGPPRSEDPTDPTLPRCQVIEQIGFRSTQIIDECDRPGVETIDGRPACRGHAHQLRRQQAVERRTPTSWSSTGRNTFGRPGGTPS